MNIWRIREWRRGFYNLFYYFKTIWNDRDWDHAYIEELQLKKLKKAYKFRTTSKWCARCIGQEKQDKALKICIDILERRLNNWYTHVWDEHYGQYNHMEFESIPGSTMSKINFTVEESANQNYNAFGYHDKVEERDWKNYCEIIKKYQQTWWD